MKIHFKVIGDNTIKKEIIEVNFEPSGRATVEHSIKHPEISVYYAKIMRGFNTHDEVIVLKNTKGGWDPEVLRILPTGYRCDEKHQSLVTVDL